MLKLIVGIVLFLIAYKIFTFITSVFFRIINIILFALLFYLLFIKYPEFTESLLRRLGL